MKETIKYRFGDNSGRHGIDRYLVEREKYDDTQDAVYAITNIIVSSPDGVATTYSQSTIKNQGGREVRLRLRIGDAEPADHRPDRNICHLL